MKAALKRLAFELRMLVSQSVIYWGACAAPKSAFRKEIMTAIAVTYKADLERVEKEWL